MEIKKQKIEQALSEIKLLEEHVSSIKTSENTSFTFFRDSYEKLHTVMRLLHEVEFSQIEEMKSQMAKLLVLMSEVEPKRQEEFSVSTEEKPMVEVFPMLCDEIETPHEKLFEVGREVEPEDAPAERSIGKEPSTPRNGYAEGLALPGYDNPRKGEVKETFQAVSEVFVKRSLNDNIQVPNSKLDIKRSLSLNDRFYFQRELFDNNREAMNNMMLKLHAFDNFPDVKEYLLETTGWDSEDETVKDFLETLRKGFD